MYLYYSILLVKYEENNGGYMFNLNEVRNELSSIDNLDLDCIFMSKEYELKKVLIEKEFKKDFIKNLSNRFYIYRNKKRRFK